jgi:hypothetical protein
VTYKLVDLMSERCVHFLHKTETLAGKGLIPRLAALLLENAENRVVAANASRPPIIREKATAATARVPLDGLLITLPAGFAGSSPVAKPAHV